MPTILPKLNVPDPSAAASGAATAAGKSLRIRAPLSPSGAADGALDPATSAFPAQLKRARAKSSDADSDGASESKAGSAKRPAKTDAAKKAKASKPAKKDAPPDDDSAPIEADAAESTETDPTQEPDHAAEGTDPANPVDSAEGSDEKHEEGGTETVAPTCTTPDAMALASAGAVTASPQPTDAEPVETETADAEAQAQERGESPSVASVTTVTSTDRAAASSPAGHETPEEGADPEQPASPQAAHAKAAATAKAATPRDDRDVRPELKPAHAPAANAKTTAADADNANAPDAAAAAVAQLSQSADAAAPKPAGDSPDELRQMVDAIGRTLANTEGVRSNDSAAPASAPNAPARPDLPPEARFAETNHANVVSSMRAQLMPNGGTMRIRLDPPQLGALQVTVHMRDGVMTASFETSTDEATRLLSHSLSQLKGVLESQGVNVEKLQVQQGPREMQSTGRNDNNQQEQPGGQQQREASRQEQQEHQRREMMRRVWRRLSGTPDPLDVTG